MVTNIAVFTEYSYDAGDNIIDMKLPRPAIGDVGKVAIATSTCILAISAVAGAVSHAYLGHVAWLVGLAIGLGAAIGAQIGVRVAAGMESALLMKGTGVLVAITAIKFLTTALGL